MMANNRTDGLTVLTWSSITALLLIAASVSHAETFLVRPDGTGDVPTIQAAIEASAPGDTVLLSDGTFSGTGNENLQVQWPLSFFSQSGDPALTTLQGGANVDGITVSPWDGFSGEVAGITFTGFRRALVLGAYDAAIIGIHDCRFRGTAWSALSINGFAVTVEDCIFEDVQGSNYGGAVSGGGNPWTFSRCVFRNNHALYSGGAVTTWSTDINFESCLFTGNEAGSSGGAVWNEDGGSIQFYGCTFYGNIAPDGSATHSGYHSTMHFHNCIVAFGQGPAADCRYSAPHAYCSDVYANEGGWGCLGGLGEEGNISLDPLFCDPAEGDFGLEEGSPCAPFSPPSPMCDLMGAYPVGCQPSDVPDRAGIPAAGPSVRPNPAAGMVLVTMPEPRASEAVEIHDAAGRLVRTLRSPRTDRASGAILFDGLDERGVRLPAGVYFVSVRPGRGTAARLVLTR